MIQCQITICQCLRFNSLRCIYNQNSPFTSCQATRHLIIKIHMSRCIYQIKNIFFSILRFIYNTNCLRLNCNASLSLQFHIIQYLRLHFSTCQQTGFFNNSVSQGRLSMIYMCYNTKISNLALFYHVIIPPSIHTQPL